MQKENQTVELKNEELNEVSGGDAIHDILKKLTNLHGKIDDLLSNSANQTPSNEIDNNDK